MSQVAVTKAHTDALSKAKIALMSRPDSAFFTTILFSLKQIWDDQIPTLCVNGLVIRINPDFFLDLTPELRVSALVHESMHVAYLHCDPDRVGSRDRKQWNWAADYVINAQLKERKFDIGEGWLYDPQYANMSVEQVYNKLPPDVPPPPMGGDITYGDPAASPDLQRQVEDILVRAAMQSQMAGDKPGTIPGEIEIFLDKLLHPKLKWHQILYKYLQRYAKNDYSFRRPNRRYLPQYYLPSLYSESLMNITFAVDASSSVTDNQFQQQVSDFAYVLRMYKPEQMDLLEFDTNVRGVHQIRSIRELMKVVFTGRGGTRIAPVLQYAIEHKPQVMMIMTDGEFRWTNIERPQHTDIIWLIYNNPRFEAPFGKVIHYEMER